MTPADNAVVLTVPAEREMMLVVRLTTSGALARSGLSVDVVSDVKLAAEEACGCLMRTSHCRSLRVSYWTEDGYFCLRAESTACDCQEGGSLLSDDEISVIRCVLSSMTDEVTLSFDDDRLRAIDMRKRLPR
ncbi:hypothetical protein ACH6CV_04535 [Bacillota bacterium Meth-B3]|nr:hypothetical protein [Christensenellaceae bacterium]MEA5066877.1 hypothetical protein [Eubacteriales bacterium]MEA5068201.1 hypothetical protein [Christensenellaceae bacterium]